jgi:3-oxoacyl-[acyl-carrier protein] reductase
MSKNRGDLVDIYSSESITDFVAKLSKSDSHIFIFFNGIADSKIFINMAESEVHSIINTNLIVPIIFTKACLARLLPKKNKYIYLTSSRALAGDRGITLYATTKSALKYFARSLALEYSNFKQFFYVISLGLFDAGLNKSVPTDRANSITQTSAIKGYVDVNDLTNAIEFAIQSDSSTGSVIYCDNGYF